LVIIFIMRCARAALLVYAILKYSRFAPKRCARKNRSDNQIVLITKCSYNRGGTVYYFNFPVSVCARVLISFKQKKIFIYANAWHISFALRPRWIWACFIFTFRFPSVHRCLSFTRKSCFIDIHLHILT